MDHCLTNQWHACNGENGRGGGGGGNHHNNYNAGNGGDGGIIIRILGYDGAPPGAGSMVEYFVAKDCPYGQVWDEDSFSCLTDGLKTDGRVTATLQHGLTHWFDAEDAATNAASWPNRVNGGAAATITGASEQSYVTGHGLKPDATMAQVAIPHSSTISFGPYGTDWSVCAMARWDDYSAKLCREWQEDGIPTEKQCDPRSLAKCQGSGPCLDLYESNGEHHLIMFLNDNGTVTVDGEASNYNDDRVWTGTCASHCDGIVGTWSIPGFYDGTIVVSADYGNDYTAIRNAGHGEQVRVCRLPTTCPKPRHGKGLTSTQDFLVGHRGDKYGPHLGDLYTVNKWRISSRTPEMIRGYMHPDDWLVYCFTSGGAGHTGMSRYMLNGHMVDALWDEHVASGTLSVNTGGYCPEGAEFCYSDMAFASLMIWDRMISESEMAEATTLLYKDIMGANYTDVPVVTYDKTEFCQSGEFDILGKGLWGRWIASDFQGPDKEWPDRSGNGRSANFSGTGLGFATLGNHYHARDFSNHAGHKPVPQILGTTSSVVEWPIAPTKSWTACAVTRYWNDMSSTRRRIIKANKSNLIMGHYNGHRGVVHYISWASRYGQWSRAEWRDDFDWIVTCWSHGDHNRIIVNKVCSLYPSFCCHCHCLFFVFPNQKLMPLFVSRNMTGRPITSAQRATGTLTTPGTSTCLLDRPVARPVTLASPS